VRKGSEILTVGFAAARLEVVRLMASLCRHTTRLQCYTVVKNVWRIA
jgi:hypothetical protein